MTALYDDMTLARPVRTRVLLGSVRQSSSDSVCMSVFVSSVSIGMCKARLMLEGQLRSLTLSECGHVVLVQCGLCSQAAPAKGNMAWKYCQSKAKG